MRGEHQAGVVRHVQPLVRVGRPRIGALDAAARDGAARCWRRPTVRTRRPRGARPHGRGDSRRSLRSGSNAPVFTLPACAQTMVGPFVRGQCLRQRIRRMRPWSSAVDANDLPRSDAEHAQRADDGHVHFVADDHAQARRALQAVGLDVPAGATQHLVARGRERREVRHMAAGHEADADVRGQPEQLERASAPATSSTTDAGRRHDVEAGVLVPGRREPVGRHGGRQRAAGDEPEIARSGGGDEAGFGGTRQLLDDGQRLGGAVGQAEPPSACRRSSSVVDRPDGSIAARCDVLPRDR